MKAKIKKKKEVILKLTAEDIEKIAGAILSKCFFSWRYTTEYGLHPLTFLKGVICTKGKC
jgi:hypothetical protein